IEMDAASNNSVDDIRELRDRVALAPVSGRHKVYILDEAHMLSRQAWNAFLKTLEEPPPSTIFVLATTEAQKVLPTVVDRCHRFDFVRPSVEQVATVLDRVVAAEGIDVDQGALALIARHATGSFRDALGTLEQLITYTGGRTIEQARSLSSTDAVRLLDLVSQALDATANGGQARIQLELVLVKAAAPELDPSMGALMARIERLEGGTVAVSAPPAEVATPDPPPAPETTPLGLEAAVSSWPAVVDLVRTDNG